MVTATEPLTAYAAIARERVARALCAAAHPDRHPDEPTSAATALWQRYLAEADTAIAALGGAPAPEWAWSPEGHDDCFEYTRSADCDGSNIQHYRRTPRRLLVIEGGSWERIAVLPQNRVVEP